MRERELRRALSVAALAAVLGACATTGTGPPHAAAGPESSVLGLTAPEVPKSLRLVVKSPYAPPAQETCEGLAAEIAALDAVLGPDVDAAASEDDAVARLASGAVRGLIPYRGVVRFVTGAGRREREMAQAVIAGSARRGFLKGVSHRLGCPAAPT